MFQSMPQSQREETSRAGEAAMMQAPLWFSVDGVPSPGISRSVARAPLSATPKHRPLYPLNPHSSDGTGRTGRGHPPASARLRTPPHPAAAATRAAGRPAAAAATGTAVVRSVATTAPSMTKFPAAVCGWYSPPAVTAATAETGRPRPSAPTRACTPGVMAAATRGAPPPAIGSRCPALTVRVCTAGRVGGTPSVQFAPSPTVGASAVVVVVMARKGGHRGRVGVGPQVDAGEAAVGGAHSVAEAQVCHPHLPAPGHCCGRVGGEARAAVVSGIRDRRR